MRRLVFGCTAMALSALLARADSPGMIHYQGRLALGTNLYSGPVNIEFRMYDAPTGGTLLHTSTNAATAVDGLYATAIGQHGVSGDLDAALTNAQVWLEVRVNGSTLIPRERLLAVPYARGVYGLRLDTNGVAVINSEAGGNAILNSFHSTIGGGWANRIDGSLHSVIGGGIENLVQLGADSAMIGGGYLNLVQTNADFVTIGGGIDNLVQANARSATISGGDQNQVHLNGDYATIGGGALNQVQSNAWYATIPGGRNNRVGPNATNAFAAGRRAAADHPGAFVWGDNSINAFVVSANPNSVTFRAAGGYRLFSNASTNLGVQLPPNATAWAAISDREAKEKIEPIEPERVLEGVKQMPVSEWQYKADPSERRYIGPMAQDFHALFGLGDDKTINTLDADGVLFAAVQALAKENDNIRRENDELRRRLEALEARLSNF